jgi:hypothetical protein
MAEIIGTPPAIHTAFNPVALRYAPQSQAEREAGIVRTLTGNGHTVDIRREYFNGLAQFDLSEILKHWFTEDVIPVAQSDICYTDRRLAFPYGVYRDSGSITDCEAIAVNAVVQLQRNPDMTAWGDRFLTGFSELKMYDGYPLDVAYLNSRQDARLLIDGIPVNGGSSITERHFCISLPPSAREAAILSRYVPLLSGSGEAITADGGTPITVALGEDQPVARIPVIQSCTPENPCYLRWINPLGGYDHRMFCRNQLYTQSVAAKTAVSPVTDDILNAGYTEYLLDREVGRSLTVGAGSLTAAEYAALLCITTSPRVEIWDTEVRKWYRVYVASGDCEHGTGETRKEIEIELTRLF